MSPSSSQVGVAFSSGLLLICLMSCRGASKAENPAAFSEIRIGQYSIQLDVEAFSLSKVSGIDSARYQLELSSCDGVSISMERKSLDFLSNYLIDGYVPVTRELLKKSSHKFLLVKDAADESYKGPVILIELESDNLECATAWLKKSFVVVGR